MKLAFVFLTVACLSVHATGKTQTISVSGKNLPLKTVFESVRQQSGFSVFFIKEEMEQTFPVTVTARNMQLESFLELVLKGQPLTYRISSQTIFLSRKPQQKVAGAIISGSELQEKDSLVDVTGKVMNPQNEPLIGATVRLKGSATATLSTATGTFTLPGVEKGRTIVVSYLGYQSKEIVVSNSESIIVQLPTAYSNLTEIVLSNGMYLRKKENFTGSATTVTGDELRTIGMQNVVKSLSVLEPSLRLFDNLDAGSDPNRLPEATVRGSSGVPDLQSEYQNAPNLPLFILDGFETTMQKVYDLNMHLIASVTILKDASAKAIYGSKAGNGVIIIETKRPAAGKMRVSYAGGINISTPDLTSYNLANSSEKLQAEVLAGVFSNAYPANQFRFTTEYGEIMKEILSGVNTDWIAQPVQNGVGHRHNLTLDGGAEGFRYLASINYNNVTGTMKGSDRATINGVVNLEYRKKNFAFRNNLSIDNNKGINSPYGAFSSYARMNPYYRIHDESGKLIQTYENGTLPNPLYNVQLNTKDFSTYNTITENLYIEWQALYNLRFTARTGINLTNNNSEYFIPAQHTTFAAITPASAQYLKRGEYTIGNGAQQMYNTDLSASYNIILGKHQIFTNLIYSIQQMNSRTNGMSMVGFPNDKMDDISLGLEYKNGTKAAGSEQSSRSLGATAAINYSYLNKYLLDFSYRASASSQFGAQSRWGNFWSAGAGWNVHHEAFMQSAAFVNQLRVRGSMGSTGTQNFSAYQALATYNYITSRSYDGELGTVLMALQNPGLRWQQIFDRNIGIDLTMFKRLSLRVDYYNKDTKDLLSDQTTAPSTGFNSYRENVGETRNEGVELFASYRIINRNDKRTYLTIFANAAHNKNKIHKVSNALKQLNALQDEKLTGNTSVASKPVTRFEEGQSLSAIWAVPSLGIDPITGSEIFLKQDGSVSNLWNIRDQVVVGDLLPKINGAFGVNFQRKGFTVNVAMNYQIGGQLYNATLVQKVENSDINYNVDRRVLSGRWRTPGQYSLYKNIADRTVTKPSTRFVQDNDELIVSSISTSYNFSQWRSVQKLGFKGLTTSVTLNDLARIGKIQSERGLNYPFARNILGSIFFDF